MELYKVLKSGVSYLNTSSEEVQSPIGTLITFMRRSDQQKYLKSGAVALVDTERVPGVMTTDSIKGNQDVPVIIDYNVGDLVGFLRNGTEYTGEITSISAKGALSIDVGVEDEKDVMRVNPKKIDVEKLA